ncbi:MAG: hypothetical protein JO019_02565 [Candidatus Kaiserbacteria bacterium]|nr:hypothetical protein [Candidatus Kaiserbacteria bacterium]
MIKTILTWVAIAMIAALLILLLINGGGFRAIRNTAHSIPTLRDFLTSSSTVGFVLPWQDEVFQNIGIDVDTGTDTASQDVLSSETGYQAPSQNLQNTQSISAPQSDTLSYGNPSPYAGQVSISAANALESDPSREYVVISASPANANFVDVSGWSLQSMSSGVRVYLPLAAAPYVLGVVNRVSEAAIFPGGTATVLSGVSPVGVSFRETLCTGYLNQNQNFSPALVNACPAGSRILPATQENVARYGMDCINYVATLPQCDFPGIVPQNLSTSCRAFLLSALSYNGCVNMYQSAPDFSLNSWRLYEGFTHELWSNDHDTIRLLDRDGRVVDVFNY